MILLSTILIKKICATKKEISPRRKKSRSSLNNSNTSPKKQLNNAYMYNLLILDNDKEYKKISVIVTSGVNT